MPENYSPENAPTHLGKISRNIIIWLAILALIGASAAATLISPQEIMDQLVKQREINAVQQAYIDQLKEARLRDRMIVQETVVREMRDSFRYAIGLLVSMNGLGLAVALYIYRTFRRVQGIQRSAQHAVETVAGIDARVGSLEDKLCQIPCLRHGAQVVDCEINA